MGKLTKEQQKILVMGVLLTFGVGYVYWNYMLSPINAKIEKNEKKLADIQSQIDKAQRMARNLPRLQAEVEALKIEVAAVEKQLPKSTDIPNVIRTLTREALREEIVFKRVSPSPEESQTYFSVIPFTISLEGTLHSLVRFLSNLGQQERIYRAENIRLAPIGSSDTGVQRLNIDLTIKTYAYRG